MKNMRILLYLLIFFLISPLVMASDKQNKPNTNEAKGEKKASNKTSQAPIQNFSQSVPSKEFLPGTTSKNEIPKIPNSTISLSSSNEDTKHEGIIKKLPELNISTLKEDAEKGNTLSQIKLALMYQKGEEVEQSNYLAWLWFSVATTMGNWNIIQKKYRNHNPGTVNLGAIISDTKINLNDAELDRAKQEADKIIKAIRGQKGQKNNCMSEFTVNEMPII